MTEEALNLYGDQVRLMQGGFGMDISSQRLDHLDNLALMDIKANLTSNQNINVLEIGAGQGHFSSQMRIAGARVYSVDLENYSAQYPTGFFLQDNVVNLSHEIFNSHQWPPSFDIIFSQRMLHHLPYKQALYTLKKLSSFMLSGSRLYVSVSGLHSELGDGYNHYTKPIEERYTYLSPIMAHKHAITGQVCLYTEQDFHKLLEAAGFSVEHIYISPFGNIKAVSIWN